MLTNGVKMIVSSEGAMASRPYLEVVAYGVPEPALGIGLCLLAFRLVRRRG